MLGIRQSNSAYSKHAKTTSYKSYQHDPTQTSAEGAELRLPPLPPLPNKSSNSSSPESLPMARRVWLVDHVSAVPGREVRADSACNRKGKDAARTETRVLCQSDSMETAKLTFAVHDHDLMHLAYVVEPCAWRSTLQ